MVLFESILKEFTSSRITHTCTQSIVRWMPNRILCWNLFTSHWVQNKQTLNRAMRKTEKKTYTHFTLLLPRDRSLLSIRKEAYFQNKNCSFLFNFVKCPIVNHHKCKVCACVVRILKNGWKIFEKLKYAPHYANTFASIIMWFICLLNRFAITNILMISIGTVGIIISINTIN